MIAKKKSNFSIKKGVFIDNSTRALFPGLGHLNAEMIFYSINKEIPNKYSFLDLQKKEFYEDLVKEYKLNEEENIVSKSFHKSELYYGYTTIVVRIKKNLFVYFNSVPYLRDCVELLYSNSTNKKELKKLFDYTKQYISKVDVLGKIFLLQVDQDGLDELRPYDVIKSDTDLEKHYNTDFMEVNEKIVSRLNNPDDKGLVLLHGKSGTGKTTYIRHLTTLVNKKLIFISPELAAQISSPNFLKILTNYSNSVLVIEDAENIIESRKGGGDSAMSNLLNLTDGLLSDCLKIQIICSFNTDISHIDKALLRKGRMIAKYEFKELEKDKAQRLSDSLGYKTKIESAITLADIFNQEAKNYQTEIEKIGFKMGE